MVEIRRPTSQTVCSPLRHPLHSLALLLVMLALLLRALVPQGFMPAMRGEQSTGFVLPIVLCTSQGMVEIAPSSAEAANELAAAGGVGAQGLAGEFAPLSPATTEHLYGQSLNWCAFALENLQHGLWQAGLTLPVWSQASLRIAALLAQTPGRRLAFQLPEARGPPARG